MPVFHYHSQLNTGDLSSTWVYEVLGDIRGYEASEGYAAPKRSEIIDQVFL